MGAWGRESGAFLLLRMNAKLYVGNLTPSVSGGELGVLFSRAGEVSELQVMLDPASG